MVLYFELPRGRRQNTTEELTVTLPLPLGGGVSLYRGIKHVTTSAPYKSPRHSINRLGGKYPQQLGVLSSYSVRGFLGFFNVSFFVSFNFLLACLCLPIIGILVSLSPPSVLGGLP